MSSNHFLSKENVSTLWDVISDEEMFKYLKRDKQENISQMFLKNLRGFYDVERGKTDKIVNMNKKYILLILNYIKKTFPQEQQPNRIKISYEELPVKEAITYEEIQNDRRSQFDRDLNRAQEDFTNAVTMKVPDVPNFADNYKEAPIKEMDKILKEMTAKRNYEVEQISRTHQSGETNVNTWLKPQETSLKSKKFTPTSQTEQNNYRKTKYLDNDGNLNPKKNVSWDKSIDGNKSIDDNVNIEDSVTNIHNTSNDDEPDENIFSKFKTVKSDTTNNKELNELKEEMKSLNSKLDKIIDLLSNKN